MTAPDSVTAGAPKLDWWDCSQFVLSLVLRLFVVIYFSGEIYASADGEYYFKLAERLYQGQGYTWLWPDGAVTYAAHYPVGYPALLAFVFSVSGVRTMIVQIAQAFLGALAAFALFRVSRRLLPLPGAIFAGALLAIDPAIVAYTPAIMTEGVTLSVLCLATFALVKTIESTAKTKVGWGITVGVLLGIATLIRPQCVLVAPVFGALAFSWNQPAVRLIQFRSMILGAAIVTSVTLAVCAPWTARNCVRMKHCALVSVNGGWNLLIGTSAKSTGHWAPVEVPEECREVFDEAGKDACFGAAAKKAIVDNPKYWLSLVPKKLAATFDVCGAAGWYLRESNPLAFSHEAKERLLVYEAAFVRSQLFFALLAFVIAGRASGGFAQFSAALGLVATASDHGYLAVIALFVSLLVARRSVLGPVRWASAAVIGSTLLIHAMFFGAGRYSLVVFPFFSLCAGALLTPTPTWRDSLKTIWSRKPEHRPTTAKEPPCP